MGWKSLLVVGGAVGSRCYGIDLLIMIRCASGRRAALSGYQDCVNAFSYWLVCCRGGGGKYFGVVAAPAGGGGGNRRWRSSESPRCLLSLHYLLGRPHCLRAQFT